MTSIIHFFVLLLLIPLASCANEYRKLYSFVCQNPVLVYITGAACVLLIFVLLYQIFCVPVNTCKRAPKSVKKECMKDDEVEMMSLGTNNV
ncbi:hypothetical protein CAEBREN_09569 [Caenorhabditis brenneri]|uniref:Uncharacterized protein n=1 Tax=Caenorhabditis brenneri TaxID=135651 RepID=G0N5W9_CAEBE|nr:hypothetical protein CAEBREN_09569 [Caenorhabditis brenneri]